MFIAQPASSYDQVLKLLTSSVQFIGEMYKAGLFIFLWIFKICLGDRSFSDVRKIIQEEINPRSRRPYIRPAVNQTLATGYSFTLSSKTSKFTTQRTS